MSDASKQPLRVLFCIGVAQPFFDLPRSEIGAVWDAFCKLIDGITKVPGINVIATMDDDRLMVGPSPNFPWTTYVLADVADVEATVAACNLLRTIPVGEYNLWRFMRIEARVGRPLAVPGVN